MHLIPVRVRAPPVTAAVPTDWCGLLRESSECRKSVLTGCWSLAVFLKWGCCLALKRGKRWRCASHCPEWVCSENFLCSLKHTTASSGSGEPPSVTNPTVLFILFLKWDFLHKVYSIGLTRIFFFQGIATWMFKTFFFLYNLPCTYSTTY